jgi:hypothetical protein
LISDSFRINGSWALSAQARGFAPAAAEEPGGLAELDVAVRDALQAQDDTAVPNASPALADIVAPIVSPVPDVPPAQPDTAVQDAPPALADIAAPIVSPVPDVPPAQADTAVRNASRALDDTAAPIGSLGPDAADSCFAAAPTARAKHFQVAASSGDSEPPAPGEFPVGCCR